MKKYNEKIDYTLLDLEATDTQIELLCINAIKLKVKSICVYPKFATLAAKYLKGSDVLLCCVYNFPDGIIKDEWTNKFNDNEGIDIMSNNNIDEVDAVLDYNLLKNNWDGDMYLIDEKLTNQINNFKVISQNKKLKVIVESGELTPEQIEYVTKLCINLNIDYIKTSTGKTQIGARLADVMQMRRIINEFNSSLKIKASGGIRTLEQIEELNNYVDRLGISYSTVNQLNNLI